MFCTLPLSMQEAGKKQWPRWERNISRSLKVLKVCVKTLPGLLPHPNFFSKSTERWFPQNPTLANYMHCIELLGNQFLTNTLIMQPKASENCQHTSQWRGSKSSSFRFSLYCSIGVTLVKIMHCRARDTSLPSIMLHQECLLLHYERRVLFAVQEPFWKILKSLFIPDHIFCADSQHTPLCEIICQNKNAHNVITHWREIWQNFVNCFEDIWEIHFANASNVLLENTASFEVVQLWSVRNQPIYYFGHTMVDRKLDFGNSAVFRICSLQSFFSCGKVPGSALNHHETVLQHEYVKKQ